MGPSTFLPLPALDPGPRRSSAEPDLGQEHSTHTGLSASPGTKDQLPAQLRGEAVSHEEQCMDSQEQDLGSGLGTGSSLLGPPSPAVKCGWMSLWVLGFSLGPRGCAATGRTPTLIEGQMLKDTSTVVCVHTSFYSSQLKKGLR